MRSEFLRKQSPAEALILLMSQAEISADDLEMGKSLARGGLDWTEYIRLGNLHDVTPLCAHQALVHLKDHIPERDAVALRETFRNTKLLNSLFVKQVEVLLERYQAESIPAIVLKGLGLVLTTYPDAGLRVLGDVDMLVKTRNRERAWQLYLANKFEALPPTFEIGDGKMHDLSADALYSIRTGEFWANTVPVWVGRQPALALNPELNLITTAISCSRKGFFYLRYLVDITEILRRHGDSLDWDLVVHVAQSHRMTVPLHTCLRLTRMVYDAEVPDTIMKQLAPFPLRRWVIDRHIATRRLADAGNPSNLGQDKPASIYLLKYLSVNPTVALKLAWTNVFPNPHWMGYHYKFNRRNRLLLIRYYFLHLAKIAALPARLVWGRIRTLLGPAPGC